MKKTKIFLVSILVFFLVINFSSCKKKGHAIIVITFGNNIVEYKYWSISYELKWSETAGYDCNIFTDEISIVDGNDSVVFSYSYPSNIPLSAFTSVTKNYGGILIGMYWYHPKPVRLRHTAHYTDTASGDTYTASGDIVIHSE